MSTIGSAAPAILPAPKFIPQAAKDENAPTASVRQQSTSVATSALLNSDAQAFSAQQAATDKAQSNVKQVQSASVGFDVTV